MLKQQQPPNEVTIIGAGIIGVCCGLSLLEKGYSVTIIDRTDPGEAASFGNAGVISPWSCVPQCLPGVWKNIPGWLIDKNTPVSFRLRELPTLLPWASKFLSNSTKDKVNNIADMMDGLMFNNILAYRHHLKGTGQEDLLVDSWYINVFRGLKKPNLEDYAWKLRIDRKAPISVIGREELLNLEPHLSGDCQSAIVIKGQARAVHPGNLCKALAKKVFLNGGNFVKANIDSLSLNTNGTYTLHGEGGNYTSKNLVLAAGIWSLDLIKSLGLKMPLISERGYHVEFPDPGIVLNNSVMDVAGKFVVSSMSGGIRSAGTTEFAQVNAPPNYARVQSLERLTKSLLPDLNTKNMKDWMGVRPSFPDNLPAIGSIPGFHNLYSAFGHSHYGMGMAPATGKIIANFISGESQNIDLNPVKPDRYL